MTNLPLPNNVITPLLSVIAAAAAAKLGSPPPRDISEHKQSPFERYSPTGHGMFSFLGSDFAQIFVQIVFMRRQV